MLLEYFANGLIAPRGGLAAIEQALWVVVLALRNSGLKFGHAVLGNVLRRGLLVGGVGWPLLGQQQILHFFVSGVVGQWLAEVVKVAIEVDIFLGDASHMRKTMGVQGVHIHHRHTTLGYGLVPI